MTNSLFVFYMYAFTLGIGILIMNLIQYFPGPAKHGEKAACKIVQIYDI